MLLRSCGIAMRLFLLKVILFKVTYVRSQHFLCCLISVALVTLWSQSDYTDLVCLSQSALKNKSPFAVVFISPAFCQ